MSTVLAEVRVGQQIADVLVRRSGQADYSMARVGPAGGRQGEATIR